MLLNKHFITTFFSVLLYAAIFYAAQVFLYNISIFSELPTDDTLARWDSPIYHSIKTVGCNLDDSGCYPLFGWVWRLCHVEYLGMAMVNIVFFAFAISLITTIYPTSAQDRFLWLTTPSLYFMFVPYSEALFCLLTAITFYGIYTKNKWLIWGGLLLVSTTRATAIFMIPSLLVMELLTNDRRDFLKSMVRYLWLYAAPVIAGTMWFMVVQYYSTGIWFQYYKGQAENLGHKLAMPILPFADFYGTERVLWLCAFALLVCMIALVIIVNKVWKWLAKNQVQADKVWIFTLGYLPLVMFTMVFCNPTWGSSTTNLLGIHRYTFCSPFIFVMLHHLVSNARKYGWKEFTFVILLSNALWLMFGDYDHIRHVMFYNFITLIAVAYMLHANKKGSWATLALCALNIFFQLHLFQLYLGNFFTD